MFNGDTLATLLHALATGYPDRAKNIVHVSLELDDQERERIRLIVDDPAATPVEQVLRLGDTLRELEADRALANECYRLAFYLNQDSVALSEDPLFAYFLAHRSGRLLDKWIHYFRIYDRHLALYRDRGSRVLEIGVSQGGSLEMWARYLGPSTTIVGIDIDESSARLADPAHQIVIGDQADADFLWSVAERHGPFDIVIDDGGHSMEQQITSVETLFPTMNDGGVYVVEDCHTSYWEEFGGGQGHEGTFIEWVKRRLDDLHRYHLAAPVDPIWTAHVDAIHCYDSLVVLDKRARTPPFSEQVGSSAFIFQHRPASALVGEMLATRDAAISQSRERDAGLQRAERELGAATLQRQERDADFQRVEADLRRAEAELTATRNDLLELGNQLKTMRGTVSWQLTAPLRRIRRFLRQR